MAAQHGILEDYIAFFERMTEADLANIATVFTPDARFKDPFNDVTGIDAITAVFAHMFETIEAPEFKVHDAAQQADIAYINWQFTGSVNNKPLHLVGLSRVVFAENGLVSEHIDYWDASEQFYMKLPVLGALLRWIRRSVSAESPV